MLDEILFEIKQMCENGKGSPWRSHSTGSVQSVTTLILTIIQTYPSIQYYAPDGLSLSSLATPARLEQSPMEEHSSTNQFVAASFKGMLDATRASDYLVTHFLKLVHPQHHNKDINQTFKRWLEQFIRDLFLLLYNPEWPSAELLIRLFGLKCIEHIGLGKRISGVAGIDSGTERDETIEKMDAAEQSQNLVTDNLTSSAKIVALSILAQIVSRVATVREGLSCYDTDGDIRSSLLRLAVVGDSAQTSPSLTIDEWVNTISDATTCTNRDATLFRIGELTTAIVAKKDLGLSTPSLRSPEQIDFGQLLQRLAKAVQFCDLTVHTCVPHSQQLTKALLGQSVLLRYFDAFVYTIINVTAHKQPTIRIKGLRVLQDIVGSEPTLLSREHIFLCFERRLADSSPAVRGIALELISKYFARSAAGKIPKLVLDRSCDIAPIVRERAIRILTSIAFSTSDEILKIDIAKRLLFRTADIETSVRVRFLHSCRSMLTSEYCD